MRFRNIDTNGDWRFGKGRNDYVQNNSAIRLNIKTRILSWVNDCFFDLDAGIDWANRLGSKGQRELLEQDLKSIIQKTDGVRKLLSFSTDLTGRRFTAQYEVETIYSTSFQDELERSI